ncbi:putative bifunctional diguanylate cyclase/phosphodiesterase [Sphingomonas beigongshangi]|uniref:putative bifunctional diguanylate cyclase/phosphodiesterase n=1 Tax=Sphingomonas beigongshangi TaxID=2782540 RepID=UPI001FEF70E6|nr:GGDEF and EAL domain-containing protein [Sphingomonas beigongshangi]
MRAFLPKPEQDTEKGSVWHLLGLKEDHDDPITRQHAARLRTAAVTWPFAGMMAVAAAAVLPIVAVVQGQSWIAGVSALEAAAMIALAACLWLLLSQGERQRWPIHLRVRALVVGSAGIAATLTAMLWTTTGLAAGPTQTAAFVATLAALIATALAIHPLRAASLGFLTSLVVTLGVVSQQWLATLLAAGFLVALVAAVLRIARVEAAAARASIRDREAGQSAARMIGEFEAHGNGWFWQTDRYGRLTYLSDKVAGDLTYDGQAPIGQLLTDLFQMDSVAPGTERTLAFHLSSRTSFADYTVRAVRDDGQPEGERRWWSISGRPLIDHLDRFQGFIGSGSDLTERRRSEAEITRLALFDSLTGLANRQRMRHSLDKTLQQQGASYRPAALFLMDLDRFKAVNDTLGHQAGDALLVQVAQRLQRGVGDAGLVGRLGGDEFQVLLPGLDKRNALAQLAQELIESLSQPYFISGTSVSIGCSIGIAIAPDHGEDAEELIRNADLALYAAKADGRGVHRFYTDAMLAGARTRKQLEDDLRTALAEGQFHLVYQPLVGTVDERIVGYEALLRWNHPTQGPISPATFIPVAEESGLIAPIGEWVLRTACAAAACWPRAVRVAVNVSPLQFANPTLPTLVASALAHARLAAHRLELEITETAFLNDSSDAMFKALKGLGVRLSLDDFGTGYSSLGYLRNAPFDKIKIDQSFVRGAAQPASRNAAIIKAIVTLADTLGMETTAEGVEVQDEIALVRALGVSHIQGFVYGPPVLDAEVVGQLGGGVIAPTGHKVSRRPRTKMLRTARITVGSATGDVRIRNISPMGVMVEGLSIAGNSVGMDVSIELVEHEMVPARVAWAHDGRAGLHFLHEFDLSRLAPQPARPLRRTA